MTDLSENLNAADTIISKLLKPLNMLYSEAKDAWVSTFLIGMSEYLRISYERCKSYKTLLSKNSISILNSYTNIRFAYGGRPYNSHSHDDEEIIIDDEEILENLDKYRSLVITGHAGSGKSMFMKYLTVKLFGRVNLNDNDVIPLFVELRKLNESNTSNIISFINFECSPKNSPVSEKAFEQICTKSKVVFILDGFDELNSDIRDKIQDEVLSLQKNYPNSYVIVSSRHDDRFDSWSNFKELTALKLNKNQALDLIQKLEIDNDNGARDRFYKRVNDSLYDSHSTFLSSPLLITIMLFTFEGEGDLPNKMHEFYASAFDVLYQRHDATKEQFKREKYTKLTKDEFSTCFSAFCTLSFQKEVFEFDEDSINKFCERSIAFANSQGVAGVNLNINNFIKDMVESVCLLQKDGLHWAFTHRSFQEYFTAKFICKLKDDMAKKLLTELSYRRIDSIYKLCFEIDKEKTQRIFVIPNILSVTKSLSKFKEINEKYSVIFDGIRIFFYTAFELEAIDQDVARNSQEDLCIAITPLNKKKITVNIYHILGLYNISILRDIFDGVITRKLTDKFKTVDQIVDVLIDYIENETIKNNLLEIKQAGYKQNWPLEIKSNELNAAFYHNSGLQDCIQLLEAELNAKLEDIKKSDALQKTILNKLM